MKKFIKKLRRLSMINDFGVVEENASLENYNTYGIKTKAKYLIKPKDVKALQDLLIYLQDNKLAYFILGKGSNVILPDTPFNGAIISLENLNNVTINNNVVEAECGVILSKLAMISINNNLEGLENLASIPGTLGGALVGNAGAYNSTIYDYIEEVMIIRDNKLITLKKEDINISYRYTIFKETHDILVKAKFKLNNGNKDELMQIVRNNREKREKSIPLEYKNAGSVFKNPEGSYAGKLIEEANLKGYAINDAEVSMKHANFIINKGNATSKDITELITFIKEEVYKKFQVKLELEQIIVKWD